MKKQLVLFSALTLASSFTFAQGVPNVFNAGQPARAADVNANFQSVVDLIDATISDIATNQANIAANANAIAAIDLSGIQTNADAIAAIDTSGIQTNASAIENLETAVSAIPNNSTQVIANTTAINAIDTSGIQINADAIAAIDTSGIQTNADAIAAIDTSGIQVNAAGIATNNDNISANVTAISDNTNDIVNNENAITGLDTRIDTLETGSGIINSTSLAVDCSSDSINDAINNAPALGSLVVNVSGACTETVVITRSNTSLVGAAGASITFDAPVTTNQAFTSLNSVISVIGAQNVVIDNFSLSGATAVNTGNGSGAGVAILHGASVLVSNSTLSGNYDGVLVNDSVGRLSGNTIELNTRSGLFALNGSSVSLIGGNVISQTTNTSVDGRAYAVGVYRSSVVRTTGNNSITGGAASGIQTISVFYNANFRSFYGLLTVNGDSRVGDHGHVEFRDVDYTGNFSIGSFGVLRLTNRAGQTESGVTFTGDITVGNLSSATGTSGTSINGEFVCAGGFASTGGAITGSTTSCF